LDPAAVRDVIRRKIITGELPGEPAVKTWVGMGNGRICRACEEPIRGTDEEIELELPLGRPSVFLHGACQTVWLEVCDHDRPARRAVQRLAVGSSPSPMTQGRMDKTVDKMRRGGLPAPTSDRPTLESGNGRRCDGCSEPITQLERMAVVVIFKAALMRFHEECYTAWSTFTR
jgi:hypothetical protein